MTVSPIFRRIFVPSDLEEAAINTLVKWFPTYIQEVERQLNLPVKQIRPPAFYTNRNTFDAQQGESFPRVVVISPGLAQPPMAVGGGQYRGLWRLGVGVAVAAATEQRANMLVKIYGAAARAVILQNQSLGGELGIAEISWVDETYDDIPIPNQSKQYRAAGIFFVVDIENVVSKRHGPTAPEPPDLDYGQVQDVIIELNKTGLA